MGGARREGGGESAAGRGQHINLRVLLLRGGWCVVYYGVGEGEGGGGGGER